MWGAGQRAVSLALALSVGGIDEMQRWRPTMGRRRATKIMSTLTFKFLKKREPRKNKF